MEKVKIQIVVIDYYDNSISIYNLEMNEEYQSEDIEEFLSSQEYSLNNIHWAVKEGIFEIRYDPLI
jgi:hypothetical protein